MKAKLEELVCLCPECRMCVTPYARIQPEYQVTGSADLELVNGKVQIYWDSLDADICFEYVCPFCEHKLAGDLEALQQLMESQQEDIR